MASLRDHQSGQTTKMLLIGDSGSGKTGSLASLADAGYNVRILDLDNGMDVLKNLFLSKASIYKPDSIDRVKYVTITDPMKKGAGGRLIPTKTTVWNRAVSQLADWKTDSPGEDFGPISTWTPQEVLVVDSLSMLCTSAMNFAQSLNARLGQKATWDDLYQGQQMVESLLQMLYDEGVKCNVIVNCHIQYIGEDSGTQVGYPASIGKALSPRIGTYFNTMLGVKTSGVGSQVKRLIYTKALGMVQLKNTAPLSVDPTYPIETGLASYFKAVRGG